jgi:hypothetical protein
LSFNKHLEKQIAQLAAAIPLPNSEKTPGKPKVQFESVNLVSTVKAKCRFQKRQGYFVDPPFITKQGDSGRPTITIGIGPHVIENAYCDLGASINVMSKVTFDKVMGGPLDPADFKMQMADQTSHKPVGIVRDILVRLQNQCIPTDFVIIDMGPNREVPLLLGRPFLYTTHAELHVGTGFARFHIKDKTLTCPFNGYKMYNQIKGKQTRKQKHNPILQAQPEQCSMIWIKYGLNKQGIAEVEIQPQLVDGLKKKNKRPEQKKKKNNPKPTKETPMVVLAPSKKKVEKPLKEAPKSTTTPATKKKKKVWVPKEKSVLTPLSTKNPSSSQQ